jgi:hypothetical protein
VYKTQEAYGVTASLSFGTILQTIVTEGTDYAKKSMDKRTAFVEIGAKSLETVIQIPIRICEDVVHRLRRAGD